jgi:hypothetical protein
MPSYSRSHVWEEPSDAPNENTFYAPRRFQNFFL